MTEYNYNLQQAPETSKQTIEPISRYEWADSIKELGDTITGSIKAYEHRANRNAKGEENALQTKFDSDVAKAIADYERTPNAPRSELDTNINDIIERYPSLSMSTKSSILKNRNYTSPLIANVEASDITTKEQAKKQAETDLEYISIANAVYSPDQIANMTTEAKIEEGKRLYATQDFNITVAPFFSSDLPNAQKQQIATITSDTMKKGITTAIIQAINENSFTPEWLSAKKGEWLQMLQGNDIPGDWAQVIVNRATKPYESTVATIKQSREDQVKLAQQLAGYTEDVLRASESLTAGMSQGSLKWVEDNWASLTEEQRKLYDHIPAALLENSQQVRKALANVGITTESITGLATPQQNYDFLTGTYRNPLMTQNQSMNGTTMSLETATRQILEGGDEVEKKSEEFKKNAQFNLKTLYDTMLENATSFVQAFKENASESQKTLIRETFRKNFKVALDNEFQILFTDTSGRLEYKEGRIISNTNKDSKILDTTNVILGNLRSINGVLGGNLFSDKELDQYIRAEMANYSLEIENSKSFTDLVAETPAKIQGFVGRMLGDEDYEPIAMTPRQAVYAANQRRKQQAANLAARRSNAYGVELAPLPEAITYWEQFEKDPSKNSMWENLKAEGVATLKGMALPVTGAYNALHTLYEAGVGDAILGNNTPKAKEVREAVVGGLLDAVTLKLPRQLIEKVNAEIVKPAVAPLAKRLKYEVENQVMSIDRAAHQLMREILPNFTKEEQKQIIEAYPEVAKEFEAPTL